MAKTSNDILAGEKISLDDFVSLFNPLSKDEHNGVITLRAVTGIKSYVLPKYFVDLFNQVFVRVHIDTKNNIVRIWSNYDHRADFSLDNEEKPKSPEDFANKDNKDYWDLTGKYAWGRPTYEVVGMLTLENGEK